MSAWALALRIARRESQRRPWRSLLVLLLVAVPVGGTVIAAVLAQTDAQPALEEWDSRWGEADLLAWGWDGLADIGDGTVPIDADAVVDQAVLRTAYSPLRTAAAAAEARTEALDPTDPIWGGRFELLEGRAPMAGGEVALSRRLAERLDVAAGERLALERPDVELDVVGVVEDRTSLRTQAVYVDPDAGAPIGGRAWDDAILLVDLGEPSDAQLQPYLFGGLEVRPLPSLVRFEPETGVDTVTWAIVVGALVLAVLGIVIAAAFAAGGRSQLVVLGQLSANGAPPSVLRAVLVLQGTVTGAVGTLVGFALAAAGLGFGRGLAEAALDRRIDAYASGPAELTAIALIGVAGATLAALVPSRTLASVPTLTAIAGRRPVAAVRPRFTVGGVVAMGSGFLLLVVAAAGARSGTGGDTFAAVAIVGGLAMLFGSAALTPAMIERLEGVARRSGGSVRLALRGLARNRVRSGAIVAAVGAAGALAVAGASVVPGVGLDAGHVRLGPGVVELSPFDAGDGAPPVPDELVAGIEGALDDPVVHRTRVQRAEAAVRGLGYGFTAQEALVVDLATARDLGLADEAVRSLERDGVVVLAFNPRATQVVTLATPSGEVIEGQLVFSPRGVLAASGLLVTPEVADRLGGTAAPGPVYVVDRDGLDEIDRFDLVDLSRANDPWSAEAGEVAGPAPVSIQWDMPSSRFDTSSVVPLLTGVAVAFALLVVAAGLALAAADDRADRQLLSVAGAGPRTMAGISGAQAAVLALLGLLLSVPLGFLPALALRTSVAIDDVVVFPSATVALLVLGVPPIAYLGARLVAAGTQRLRPLRISTATFD